MELIVFFGLVLVLAAILFPEGTRAFFLFAVKTTAVVVIAIMVGLIVVGVFTAHSTEPVKKVSGPTHRPASFVVLDDGTQLDLIGGWYNADGDLLLSDEDDALRVRLYREGLAALQK